ncbi:hypothetical protein K1719_008608 [Acacia pycnantha]|nr:hypothetical protein K1719_008608 [Acacia pycnantha]
MLGNCEKMVVMPPTTDNEWPQIVDHHQKISSSSMGSGGRTATMEKPSGQEQQSLKCPRCASTNTKFCYYNNYSLSQPRHFCKSCKRYWTRGGTLRNVPAGGGCRKNKRVKRQTPPSSSDHTTTTPSSSSSPSAANNSNLPSHQPHIDAHHVTPLFYGLPPGNSVNSDMNLAFPRFNNSGSYDHLNSLGLASFSSGYTSNDSLFSNHNSIFGGSSSTAISSLLYPSSTNPQQQKLINGGLKDDF